MNMTNYYKSGFVYMTDGGMVGHRTCIALKLSLHISVAGGSNIVVSRLARAMKVSRTTAKKELVNLCRLGFVHRMNGKFYISRKGISLCENCDVLHEKYKGFAKEVHGVDYPMFMKVS